MKRARIQVIELLGFLLLSFSLIINLTTGSGIVFAQDNEMDDEDTIPLGRIVITASRMAQHDYRVTGNVMVIDSEDIEESNARSIPDILTEALNVHVVNNSTNKTSVLDIRGFGDSASRNVLVLVNDRVLNTVDISSPDLLQIPLSAVERIEIVRGAGSVLYGDRAVGGVVNIITKKGEGNLSGRVGFHGGSFDARGTDLEVSGSKNQLSYFFYSSYDDDHGYRQNSDVLAKDFSTHLAYEVSKKMTGDVEFSYHKDDYGLPGALSGANLSAMGPRASTRPEDFANSRDQNLKLGFNVAPWPEDLYLGSLALDLYFRDRDVFDSFGGFDTSRSINTTGITAKYMFDHTVFDKEVNFVTGLDFYDTENNIIGSGFNSDDLTVSRSDIGIYGFAEYEALTDIFINGGLRYYKADYAFSQRNGVNVDEKQDPDVLVYMGGLKYEYAKGSNLHASVQRTFRFLATDEWYSSFTGTLDTTLEQQKGIQYEVGVKHSINDALQISVTPYLMDIHDEIFFDPTTFTNSNYDETRRAGVEIGQETDLSKFIKGNVLKKFKITTNYTYQKPLFIGGVNDDKQIPLVPRQQVSSGIVTQLWDEYNFSLFGNYVGSQFAINDLTNEAPKVEPYFTVDAKIAYKKPNYEIYGAINNLFNQLYSTTVTKSAFSSAESFYPAPGRNFDLGVNIKF